MLEAAGETASILHFTRRTNGAAKRRQFQPFSMMTERATFAGACLTRRRQLLPPSQAFAAGRQTAILALTHAHTLSPTTFRTLLAALPNPPPCARDPVSS